MNVVEQRFGHYVDTDTGELLATYSVRADGQRIYSYLTSRVDTATLTKILAFNEPDRTAHAVNTVEAGVQC